MLLDLFITHWNEAWEVGAKNIYMLATQRGVDWDQVRVTMVHDGSEGFPADYFSMCPFEVRQVCLPHGGIAAARNWCIEHAEADWIRWCDFDDMWSNVYALRNILNVLNTDAYDLLWFDMICEDHGRYHTQTKRDPVVVHNKIIRRQFLLDKGIRFNEDLTWCEDSAFLAVIEMDIDHQRIGKIKVDYPMYIYIARDGSLCNRPEIRFQNLQSFFRRHTYVAEEFRKRGLTDQYNTMCVRVMCDSYYTLHRAQGITEDKSAHERMVWDWYDAHREPYHACRRIMYNMVIDSVNRECFDGGSITAEEVMAWIDRHERGEI